MSTQRVNTVMVGLVAALIVPHVERLTGVKLSTDDVAELIGAALIVWHGGVAAIEKAWEIFQRYYPPPVPDASANPMQPLTGAAN